MRVAELATTQLTADIHVSFSLHETRSQALPQIQPAANVDQGNKPIVLMTGASGGLGRHLSRLLTETYHVVGLTRSPQVGDGEWIAADLNSPHWESLVDQQLHGRRLYGLVHTAWPTAPQGSLLETDPSVIRTQLEFGGLLTIRLAQFLRSHSTTEGGRFVLLGTTAATLKPVLNMAAYSLGKAALEHTVRLLAPELARGNITINLIAPSFVPAGMNDAKTNRVILTETAKVPLGRLCAPEDVARSVAFFLSPGAAFITGHNLPLTGGQL